MEVIKNISARNQLKLVPTFLLLNSHWFDGDSTNTLHGKRIEAENFLLNYIGFNETEINVDWQQYLINKFHEWLDQHPLVQGSMSIYAKMLAQQTVQILQTLNDRYLSKDPNALLEQMGLKQLINEWNELLEKERSK